MRKSWATSDFKRGASLSTRRRGRTAHGSCLSGLGRYPRVVGTWHLAPRLLHGLHVLRRRCHQVPPERGQAQQGGGGGVRLGRVDGLAAGAAHMPGKVGVSEFGLRPGLGLGFASPNPNRARAWRRWAHRRPSCTGSKSAGRREPAAAAWRWRRRRRRRRRRWRICGLTTVGRRRLQQRRTPLRRQPPAQG